MFSTLATKRDTWFIYFVLGVSLLLSLVILFDPSPLVRGPKQWRWELLPWAEPGLILVAAGTVGLFLALWFVLGRGLLSDPTRRRIWMSLAGLVLLTLLVQVGFLAVFRANPAVTLFDRSASNQTNGFFLAAQGIEDPARFLRDYPELMPTFSSSHVRTKPPGILLLYWGASRSMEQIPWPAHPVGEWFRAATLADQWLHDLSDAVLASNALVSLLIPLVSTLAVLPAYGFASRRWGSMAGWIAAGLVALIPGRLAFAPLMDTVYVFSSVTALYLADTGLIRGQLMWIFGAGILLSVTSVMSPTILVIAALLGFYLIFIHVWQHRGAVDFKLLALQIAALAAGTLSMWFVYWVLFGVSFFDIIKSTVHDHVFLDRSYWFWLVGDIVDFVLLAGLPALILTASWPFLKRHSLVSEAVAALAISFWTTLLLLDISGIIRGEVGRIWLMLAPFPAILAGAWLVYVTYEPGISSLIHRNRTLRGGFAILASTALITLSIGLRWHVLVLEWPTP